ncbi:hypothetical protein [Kordiimonas sp. SCSIO 12610]|uniref:hypothetical protein n=1 Tax=Kordiimonas sp. SCSIO 12610 TaxID=2829597 RepID=UPI00210DC71D|nr:hypothetical protein [Kordiimonas sp. SCSIO 12610]UTW56433.1 hypothetical protein KFF44_05885 [Kordiimonas sp. SCSIO 12610]
MKKQKNKKRRKRKTIKISQNSNWALRTDWLPIFLWFGLLALIASLFFNKGLSATLSILLGTLIALTFAIEVDPKKWGFMVYLCTGLGGVIGYLFALEKSLTLDGTGFSILAGLVVGFFSQIWVKHLQI